MRPAPRLETAGRFVCELEAGAFFARADANDRVLMGLVRDGTLALEDEEDVEVLQRWPSGAELAADLESRQRKIPAAMRAAVQAIASECVIREPCRTRRLRKL